MRALTIMTNSGETLENLFPYLSPEFIEKARADFAHIESRAERTEEIIGRLYYPNAAASSVMLGLADSFERTNSQPISISAFHRDFLLHLKENPHPIRVFGLQTVQYTITDIETALAQAA